MRTTKVYLASGYFLLEISKVHLLSCFLNHLVVNLENSHTIIIIIDSLQYLTVHSNIHNHVLNFL